MEKQKTPKQIKAKRKQQKKEKMTHTHKIPEKNSTAALKD